MRPLAIHQQALSWLCVSHQEENSNQWRKFAQIGFTVLVFVVNIFGLVSSFIYFTDFVLTDLAGSLYGLLQGIGMVTAVYSLVINLALRREIIGVYNYLDRIYKECKHNFCVHIEVVWTEFISFHICACGFRWK